MRMQQGLRLGALLAAAGGTFGCHAHEFQSVSTIDHQVTVEFFRNAIQPSKAEVRITNGSGQPICLGPAAFDPSSFSVKTDKGMVQTIAPPAPAGPDCSVLAAGAVKALSVDAGAGFSRLEIQTGRMCYNYAFGSAPVGGAAWRTSGAVCE